MPTEAMLTIGAFARRADVNPRTLRYDERSGVLTPAARTDAGYRLYLGRRRHHRRGAGQPDGDARGGA